MLKRAGSFEDKKEPRCNIHKPCVVKLLPLTAVSAVYFNPLLLKLTAMKKSLSTVAIAHHFPELTREQVETNLVNSGLWTALRTRPYSRPPN